MNISTLNPSVPQALPPSTVDENIKRETETDRKKIQ